MDNELRTIGDCYKKFGKKNTSVSENKNSDDYRFVKKYGFTDEELKGWKQNSGLFMGSRIHEAVQDMLTKHKTIDEVMVDLKNKSKDFEGISEADTEKAKFITKVADKIIKNFVGEVLRIDDGRFKAETEYMYWDNKKWKEIEICWRMFIDLEGSKYFIDLKNIFGQVRKNKKGYGYSEKKINPRAFTSDLMQIALYSKQLPHLKPCLIYATANEVYTFTPENTPELKPDFLELYYEELMQYQMAWQNKLKIADGDPKKLLQLIRVDWSSIRKKDYFWAGMPDEIYKKLKGYYV